MATISPPIPNKLTTPSQLLVRESKIILQVQSLEVQKLAELTETIWQNLTPVERLLESLEDVSEISYRSMQPKRAFTVRVRYQQQGRGEPLPYPLEDE